MQLNAEIVSIKSLYIEPGSKRLEPGEKYSVLYGKSCLHIIAFHPILKIFT